MGLLIPDGVYQINTYIDLLENRNHDCGLIGLASYASPQSLSDCFIPALQIMEVGLMSCSQSPVRWAMTGKRALLPS